MPFIRKVATINLNAINSPVKKSLLRDFIWDYDLDIIFVQELAFENFSFISSHTAIVNISEDKKGTGVLLRNNVNYSDVILNVNGRITSLTVDSINYINIYGHSGSGFKKEREILFRDDILIHLAHGKENLIVGDFNCVLNGDDMTGSVKNFCGGLKTLIASLELKDIEKVIMKNQSQYTFVRGTSRSRLDRFYASEQIIRSVREVKTVPLCFSDHHSVFLKLEVPETQDIIFTGRGYWKLNSHILTDDETMIKFENFYNSLKTRNSYNNVNFWWNNDFKFSVKTFFKKEHFQRNQQINREKSFYYNCLHELFLEQNNGKSVDNEMKIVKSKLMQIEQNKLAFYKGTLHSDNILQDEKISLFQIATRLKKSNPSSHARLRINGQLTSNTSILKAGLYDHYSQNFKKHVDSNLDNDNVLSTLRLFLSDADKEALIQPIEMSELDDVVRNVSKNSSPGPDGLPYAFYRKCYDILKHDLLKLFNQYLTQGDFPPALFSAGIITLIPKKGDSHDLNNRRPISMLNTDYKLFTKILWSRLQPLLSKLLGPGQSACVVEQSCVNNVRTLRNIILKAKQTKHFKGMLLSLDLEKAFDRVDHDFLWSVLEKFNFPAVFINCLKRLYKNATSKVLFNGFLTNAFPIETSVRQGCPLSMALFCLYIEPLVRMLYDAVGGCLISNYFVKVVAYADDINVLIRNNHEFDKVLELVNYFSIYAKIKLNIVKSKFIRFNNCNSGPHQIEEVDYLKILGVKLYTNYNAIIETNYTDLISKIKYIVNLHQRRNLNIFQKTIIINTLLLSKLWYIAQIFPPNNKHIAQIRQICFRFLWKGQFYHTSKDQLYLPVYKGGLALEDVECKAKSLFIRNILYMRKESQQNIDEFMLQQNNNRTVTRNTREWLQVAQRVKQQNTLSTTSLIYAYLLNEKNITPKIQDRLPNINWESIWENMNQNFLSTSAKSSLFLILNDLTVKCSDTKYLEYRIPSVRFATSMIRCSIELKYVESLKLRGIG